MRLVDALAGELHLLDGSLSGCIYCEEIDISFPYLQTHDSQTRSLIVRVAIQALLLVL